MKEAIEKKFGSFDEFKKAFSDTAAGHFGSGWAWLVKNESGEVEVPTSFSSFLFFIFFVCEMVMMNFFYTRTIYCLFFHVSKNVSIGEGFTSVRQGRGGLH